MGKSHINKNKNVQHNLKYGIWVKPFSAIEIGKFKTNSISCISTQNHKSPRDKHENNEKVNIPR